MKIFEYTMGLFALSLVACYTPEPFEADDAESSSSQSGSVYAVNAMQQVCNPSVSNDTVNYPASMLWLNFSGKLNVNARDSIYTLKRVPQHDRLSVTDTAGNVKWYIMRDVEKGECQFQDPEWSTHSDFIVALRGYDKEGRSACENLDYGIFVVRTGDKKKFWFFEKNIGEEACPHVWVDPSAKWDKKADASTLEGFFGTDEVRLVYVINDNKNISFVDYANGGTSKSIELMKPSSRKDWSIDSPMISPDGKFVVYNMVDNPTHWEAYVQELKKDAVPMLVESGLGSLSAPAQPRWYADGDKLFAVWAEFPMGSQMLNKDDLTVSSVQNGSMGRTMMREIKLTPGSSEFEWNGDANEIAQIPMTGGLSPDGKFLATGTNYAFLYKMP